MKQEMLFPKGKFWANRKLLLFTSIFLMLLTTTCGDDGNVISPGGRYEEYYGVPYKVTIKQVPDNDVNINFGIIADTHVDAKTTNFNRWDESKDDHNNSEKMHNNRSTIDDINIDCGNDGCLGAVHLGDMRNEKGATQQLVAFRQLYENGYPGYNGGAVKDSDDPHHDAYSLGYRIKFPVFPTLGNHDAVSEWSDPNRAADYLDDRIHGAQGLLANHGKGTYIWRWGRYVFIQLNFWAGSSERESVSDIIYDKLRWLDKWLKEHVGDRDLGILIFHHYGWDRFSTQDADWWSQFQRNLELDVLCRRGSFDDGYTPYDPSKEDCPPCNNYNVVGIFTGHAHSLDFIQVYAGHGIRGNEVNFDNISIPSAGVDQNNQIGFSIAYLNSTTLKICTKNRKYNTWHEWEKALYIRNP